MEFRTVSYLGIAVNYRYKHDTYYFFFRRTTANTTPQIAITPPKHEITIINQLGTPPLLSFGAFSSSCPESSVVSSVDAAVSSALTALLAHALSTVCTDGAAVLADLRTFAAPIAVLAEEIIRTFPTYIAGRTEFIRAV